MSENKPPIDVFEELIIDDNAKNMFGFFAEGVSGADGKWHELGVNTNGDFLWCWTTVDKITAYHQHKGWVVSGNKPKFIKNKWLVMGFEPSIFYSYFGDKTIDRIKIKNGSFFINNTIKVNVELVKINEVLSNTKDTSFIVSDSQINRLIKSEEAPIDVQLKFFFPIIELSHFIMQGFDQITALNKFIKRTKYFLSVSPVKHYLFKIINREIITLNKLPIENKHKDIIKNMVFSNNSNTTKNIFINFKNLKTVYFGIAYVFPEKIKDQDINEIQKQLSNIEVYMLSILEKL